MKKLMTVDVNTAEKAMAIANTLKANGRTTWVDKCYGLDPDDFPTTFYTIWYTAV